MLDKSENGLKMRKARRPTGLGECELEQMNHDTIPKTIVYDCQPLDVQNFLLVLELRTAMSTF